MSLKPKERIIGRSIREFILQICTKVSYRGMCQILNNAFHRNQIESFKLKTLSDRIESVGRQLSNLITEHSCEVLEAHSFDPTTGLPVNPEEILESIRNPEPIRSEQQDEHKARFRKQIASYNEGKDSAFQIKDSALIQTTETDPSHCVYVSIDDVGVKHQRDTRKDQGSKIGKYVENTVIHIQAAEGNYVLTKVGMDDAFKQLLAFLLENKLLENRHLYFFSDGAQNIRSGIEKYFSFCPYVHMLDWYHLEKKMTELLSMALKGDKESRHEIRYHLARILWAGNVDDAVVYLRSLEEYNVKNTKKLDEAITYLERKKPYICCFALRKYCGYRNSSNPAEKTNDLIVACRQKHNGMSWSKRGSHALASISSAVINGEINTWLTNHKIRFSLSSNCNSQDDFAA